MAFPIHPAIVRRLDEHRDRIWRATTAAAPILFAGFSAGAAASAGGGGDGTLGRAMLAALWLNIGLTLIGLWRRDGGDAAAGRSTGTAAPDAPADVTTRRGLIEAGAAQLRAAHARGRGPGLLLIATEDRVDAAQTAAEIAAALPPDTLLARVDERTFAGLLVLDPRALGRAERLAGALVGAGTATAVGVALSDHTGTIDAMLRQAETAMAAARVGGGVRRFTPAMADALRARATLEHDLRASLRAGEINPVFERQFEPAAGRLTGLEVRGRWTRADGHTLDCDAFLPCAQDIGIADDLWLQVIRQALAAARGWEGAVAHRARFTCAVPRRLTAPEDHSHADGNGLPRLAAGDRGDGGGAPRQPAARAVDRRQPQEPGRAHRARRIRRGADEPDPAAPLPFDRIAVDAVLVDGLCGVGAARATVSAIAGLGDSFNLPVAAAGVADAGAHARCWRSAVRGRRGRTTARCCRSPTRTGCSRAGARRATIRRRGSRPAERVDLGTAAA